MRARRVMFRLSFVSGTRPPRVEKPTPDPTAAYKSLGFSAGTALALSLGMNNIRTTVITRGALVVVVMFAGLLVSARAAQAQTPSCAVWSHAENRCLREAPPAAAVAACTVWSHAEQRCLAPESDADLLAHVAERGRALREASSERIRQAQALATPIAPQLEAVRGRADRASAPAPAPVSIATKCATDWPTDFRMRAYCQTQQTDALGKLAARHQSSTLQTAAGATIRAKCAGDWPNDPRMTNYCEEQQLKALASLR
jgi:hypothetical protein